MLIENVAFSLLVDLKIELHIALGFHSFYAVIGNLSRIKILVDFVGT